MADFTYGGSSASPASAPATDSEAKKKIADGYSATAAGIAPPAKPADQATQAQAAISQAAAKVAPAPAPTQTFAQQQAAGQARPAPQVPAPAAPAASSYDSNYTRTPAPYSASPASDTTGVRARITSLLANPQSSYDSAAMQHEYDVGGRGIDDDFALQQTRLGEEMAGRGLSDSSIRGGRTADLNVGQRSAKTALMDSLLTKQADKADAAKAASIANALQLMGLDQQEAQSQASLMVQARGQDVSSKIAADQLKQGGQQFDSKLNFDREVAGTGRDQFDRTFGLQKSEVDTGREQWQKNYDANNAHFDSNQAQQSEFHKDDRALDIAKWMGLDGIGTADGGYTPLPADAAAPPPPSDYTPPPAINGPTTDPWAQRSGESYTEWQNRMEQGPGYADQWGNS